MTTFTICTLMKSLTKPGVQRQNSCVDLSYVNVHCLCMAFGLLLTYLFFLLFPFHWQTLALFAGLIVGIVLLSFISWPIAGWLTLVACAVTMLYGLLYAYAFYEYGLLICCALLVVTFIVLRLISRQGTSSTVKVHIGTRVAKRVLSSILALTIISMAIPLSILPNPKIYLATALAFIQGIGYNSSQVNWFLVNSHALVMIRDAKTSQDTYIAIEYVLSQLGDHHSDFWNPQFVNDLQEGRRTGPGFLTAGAKEWQMNENLVVAYVYPGSAADKAGITSGDTVRIISVRDPIMTVKWKPSQPSVPEHLLRLNMKTAYNAELGSNGRRVSKNIGYINMYGTIAESYAMNTYASKLHKIIQQVDMQPRCGWIVDLRLNQGGYLESMIQGIGPILGEGTNLVKYIDIQGNIIEGYGYKSGALLDRNGNVVEPFTPISAPYELKVRDPPVAVLIGPNTASAGEGTLMAFLGRAKTRTFGEHTYGVPTGNGGLLMIDGARLLVMTEIGSDRTEKIYQSAIAPDELIRIDWKQYGTDHDPVIHRAQNWLESQSTCKAL